MAEYDELLDSDSIIARIRAAGKRGNDQGFHDAIAANVKGTMTSPALGWLAATKVPYNVTVGGYKAALNLIETGADAIDWVREGAQGAVQSEQAAKSGTTPKAEPPPIPLRDTFPGFFENAHAIADLATRGNTLPDDLVQGVSQFALPFAGFLKLAGGLKHASTVMKVARSAAAEGVTAAGAFDPQEGRLADLAQLGLEAEGRFGDLLRKVAPDGSLVNQYIDYMTNREDEGRWEGRFKNAVDTLVGTGALAGFLKSAATSFRVAKTIAAETPKVGRAAQRGSIGVEDELTDIERARALKNTEVVEGGEHVVLEGDTLNTNADVVPIRPEKQ